MSMFTSFNLLVSILYVFIRVLLFLFVWFALGFFSPVCFSSAVHLLVFDLVCFLLQLHCDML